MSTPANPVPSGKDAYLGEEVPPELPTSPNDTYEGIERDYPRKEYPPFDPGQMDLSHPYREKLPGTQKFWMDTITSSKPEVPSVFHDVLSMPQARVPGTIDAPAMGYPSVGDAFRRQQDDQLNRILKNISIKKALQKLNGLNI